MQNYFYQKFLIFVVNLIEVNGFVLRLRLTMVLSIAVVNAFFLKMVGKSIVTNPKTMNLKLSQIIKLRPITLQLVSVLGTRQFSCSN